VSRAAHAHASRPPGSLRESPPSIEAPPQDREALDRWADRYGVRDRRADRLPLEHMQNAHFGYALDGLPRVLDTASSARGW
jgi:hypothetical protein